MSVISRTPTIAAPRDEAELRDRLQALSEDDLNLLACCANSIDEINTWQRCGTIGGPIAARDRTYRMLEQIGLPVDRSIRFPKPSAEVRVRLKRALARFDNGGMPLTNEQRKQCAAARERAENARAIEASRLVKKPEPSPAPESDSRLIRQPAPPVAVVPPPVEQSEPAAPAARAPELSVLATALLALKQHDDKSSRSNTFAVIRAIAAGESNEQLAARFGWASEASAGSRRSVAYSRLELKQSRPYSVFESRPFEGRADDTDDRPARLARALAELKQAGLL